MHACSLPRLYVRHDDDDDGESVTDNKQICLSVCLSVAVPGLSAPSAAMMSPVGPSVLHGLAIHIGLTENARRATGWRVKHYMISLSVA